MNALVPMSAEDVSARLNADEILLVDVREPDEQAREQIMGAVCAPLSVFEAVRLDQEAGRDIVFMCRSGMRTREACSRLAARIDGPAYVLEGGLEAWKKAGLPVKQDVRQPLELMRQVHLAAGSLILLGALLGAVLHPGFWGLCAFVGAGLVFAGATGFCGMARLLALMPWNRHMQRN